MASLCPSGGPRSSPVFSCCHSQSWAGQGLCPAQPSDVGSGSAVGLPWLPAHLTHPSQHILKLPFKAALRHSPSSSIPWSPAHSRGQGQPGQSETAALTNGMGPPAGSTFRQHLRLSVTSDPRAQILPLQASPLIAPPDVGQGDAMCMFPLVDASSDVGHICACV